MYTAKELADLWGLTSEAVLTYVRKMPKGMAEKTPKGWQITEDGKAYIEAHRGPKESHSEPTDQQTEINMLRAKIESLEALNGQYKERLEFCERHISELTQIVTQQQVLTLAQQPKPSFWIKLFGNRTKLEAKH